MADNVAPLLSIACGFADHQPPLKRSGTRDAGSLPIGWELWTFIAGRRERVARAWERTIRALERVIRPWDRVIRSLERAVRSLAPAVCSRPFHIRRPAVVPGAAGSPGGRHGS